MEYRVSVNEIVTAEGSALCEVRVTNGIHTHKLTSAKPTLELIAQVFAELGVNGKPAKKRTPKVAL